MEEIKTRIENVRKLRERIEELGGEHIRTASVRDTYFSGQGDDALKITETEGNAYLRRYEKKDQGFRRTINRKLAEPGKKRTEMKREHGIYADQNKEQEFYRLDGKKIILNSIDGVGDFLVVQGEEVEKSFVEEELAQEDPEYVEVPFSDLG